MQLRFPLNIDYAKDMLVLSTNEERLKFSGVTPNIALRVLQYINSGNTRFDSEPEFADNLQQIKCFLKSLTDEGLLTHLVPDTYSGHQIADVLKALYDEWNYSLFSHPLWTGLSDGTVADSVVDGWVIESYHFIRGANARLNYAASVALDERIKSIFTQHYIEEYEHFAFFADSIRRCGFDPSLVDAMGPLPTTTAVVNMARRAARSDSLAYAACSGLLESTGSNAKRARDFYCAVEHHFDRKHTRFVTPMLKHIDLDEAFEHGSIMKEIFEPILSIPKDRADKIIETVFLFQETLKMWFEDILLTYRTTTPDSRHAILHKARM